MPLDNASSQPNTQALLAERALVERAKTDPHAFALLYERYVDRIYVYVYRRTRNKETAQDITAATFEKALRNLPRFTWQGAGFRAWLYRIAHNQLVSQQRRQRFLTALSLNQPSEFDVEWLVQRNAEDELLHRALHDLSARDQEIVTLRFFEELTSVEVADILGCSVDNVYLRLHRALTRLGKRFAELQEDPIKGDEAREKHDVWQQSTIKG